MGDTNQSGNAGAPPPRPRTGNRGFSPLTTLILVVLLLGALGGVGYMINPPPPEAPKAEAAKQGNPTPPPGPEPKKMQEQVEQQRKRMEEERIKHEAMIKANEGKEPKLINSQASDVTSNYFKDHSMGTAGVKQTEAEIAHTKMLEAAAEKALGKKGGPSSQPTMSPASGAPDAQ